MSPVNIYERISIDPPYKKIYHRLGFKKKTTELTAQQQKETDIFIEDALSFITLKGCTLRTVIRKNDGSNVVIADALAFASRQLAKFLGDCRGGFAHGRNRRQCDYGGNCRSNKKR